MITDTHDTIALDDDVDIPYSYGNKSSLIEHGDGSDTTYLFRLMTFTNMPILVMAKKVVG